MLDLQAYTPILQAAYEILGQNQASLGKQFCEGFMVDYDPARGMASQRNAEQLYNYVVDIVRRQYGSNDIAKDALYEIVKNFIGNIFNIYQQKVRQQAGGFNGGGGGFGSNQGFGGGGFTRPAGGGFSTGSGFGSNQGFGQTAPITPGSHLDDPTVSRQAPPAAAAAPVASSSSTVSFAPMSTTPKVEMSNNPMDSIPDSGVDFRPVDAKSLWGDTLPRDRRIVIAAREDMKTRDDVFSINRTGAFHQLIMDNPVEVARDFFKVAPDSLLSSSFVFSIGYNHLEVIDVPTADFIQVRSKCLTAVSANSRAMIHEKIGEVLNDMQRGPYKHLTAYLVKHVNRALWLSARLSSDPTGFIKINEFDDINDLLSSTFNHPFTRLPEGRHLLEKIVGTALYNALVMNTSVMFTGTEIPTNAIQSSPAFPFSLEGVYPSKYAIPQDVEGSAEIFMKNMQDRELSKRTYTLSRRAVVITNILGKNVLPNLTSKPTIFSNPAAALMGWCRLGHASMNIAGGFPSEVVPYVSEEFPSTQLESYYTDTNQNENEEREKFERTQPAILPVDQTIFAVQYKTSPEKYMTALDVFSTLDDQMGGNKVILAKRDVPDISVNA